jgi:oligoendopeptidase F
MKYIKVKDNSDLVRDVTTNSIINTNINEYQRYLSMKIDKDTENKKMKNFENDLDNIKNDINEIKSLLRSLINEPR